jgi:lysophospholipase L1-like esterase
MGVLLGLLVLECGLQAGAFWIKRTKRAELPIAWLTGNLRVLCLGDSNTYGLWLERSEAYPQQLEALWNERIESPKLEVLNLGFPGANSSRLARDLPRLLETFEPDIVLLMIGVNDFWTLPFPLDGEPEARSSKNFVQQHSLVYRLYYLIRRGRVADKVEILMDPAATLEEGARHKARLGDQEFEMGFLKAAQGLQGDQESLKRNLRRLVEAARDSGVPVYLMTYPAREGFYGPTNSLIGAAARDTGTPLIDLAETFAPVCPTPACPDLLFPDGHPKAVGYRIVAETIVKRLAQRNSP